MFSCPFSHSVPNGKRRTKVITFTLYDEVQSLQKHMPNHTFYCFSLWAVCFTASRAVFLSGEEVLSRENRFCGGWTATLGLCTYHCGIAFTGLPDFCHVGVASYSQQGIKIYNMWGHMCVHTCGHACKCACENQRSTVSVVHHDTVCLALLRLRLTSTWNSLSRILGWLVIKRTESDCLCLSNIPMPVFCMWLWVRNWRTHDCFLSSLLVRPTHWVQLRLLKHNTESCSHTITTPKHANVSAKEMEKSG